MDRDRWRVLGFTLVYAVLVVVSGFALDWYVLSSGGGGQVTLDLRDATACGDGQCSSVALGRVPGLGPYVYGAWMTFWGTLMQTLLVVFQMLTRILSGFAHPRLSRMGVINGMVLAACAAATGFILGPEAGPLGDVPAVSFDRTLAPVLMIVAHVAGIFALHHAAHEATHDDVGVYKPVVLARPGTAPGAGTPAGAAPPGAPLRCPAHLEQRLRYVVPSAELTRAGIDARREDGSSLLVLWRDVVGVIARRLPAELDGETFVDLVSTAGSTLRVLPWTRLTGEPLVGAGDARARALVTFIAAHCPEARIDPATRAFVDSDAPAEQLAGVPELAVYDARLA
jgi:hypothetical protein